MTSAMPRSLRRRFPFTAVLKLALQRERGAIVDESDLRHPRELKQLATQLGETLAEVFLLDRFLLQHLTRLEADTSHA